MKVGWARMRGFRPHKVGRGPQLAAVPAGAPIAAVPGGAPDTSLQRVDAGVRTSRRANSAVDGPSVFLARAGVATAGLSPPAGPLADSHGLPIPLPTLAESSSPLGHLLVNARWSRVRILVDVVMLLLASSTALLIPVVHAAADVWLAALFVVLAFGMLVSRRPPDERLLLSALDVAMSVIQAVSVAVMLTITVAALFNMPHPVRLAVALWLLGLAYVGTAELVLLRAYRYGERNPEVAAPTLIVGAGVVARRLAARLINNPSYGLRPVGVLDSDPLLSTNRPTGLPVPVLGAPDELAEVVAETGARQVILAFSTEPDSALLETVKECHQLGIGVSLVPRLFDAVNERATLDYVGGLPLLRLRPTNPRGWQFAVKHCLDRGLAFLGLVLLAPLMIAIAAAVRLTSPGPALFRQRRVGRDGRVFDVLKFRTMREAALIVADPFVLPHGCAPGGVEGVDRRTPIGGFLRTTSLDELPQLINVLKGDMSLVGPRPERPEFAERFAREVIRYDDRLRVKSGITGWAQVNGLRGQTSIADRVEWDNHYIENWSLGLDLRVLALTVKAVLQAGGDPRSR